MQTFLLDKIATPIGELMVVADENHRLRALEWSEFEGKLHRTFERRYRDSPVRLVPSVNPGGLSDTLQRYFDGELTAINSLPVAGGGTEFQQQVWKALRDIPCPICNSAPTTMMPEMAFVTDINGVCSA